jgi:uncharacterized protein (DUF2141 family)
MNNTDAIMGYISASGIGSAAPTTGLATSPRRTLKRMPGMARKSRLVTAGVMAWAMLAAAAPVTRLDVEVGNVRSAKGMIRICLTADPANFPACVAIIHDENSNAKLDTFAGIPREGYGFSRDAAVRFGPPRFSAARFMLAGDAEIQQVKMRYIF